MEVPEPVITAGFLAGGALAGGYAAYVRSRRLWSGRARRLRSRRVELLAEDAVLDDPAFDPDTVKAAAVELHADVTEAWSAGDHRRLKQLLGPDLLQEWTRRRDALRRKGWTNPVRRRGRLRVRYVGLVNRPGEAADRVVVHVRARMDDGIYDHRGRIMFRDTRDSGRRLQSEYWTLGRPEGRWVLFSVETESEGAHHLTAPIITSPWADDRLHDATTLERAATSGLPQGQLAEIVPLEFSGDLRIAALDLAGFDGRFDPAVLEAAARQAVAAWADAVDGDDQPLIRLAGEQTAGRLLFPQADRRSRLVIRAPRLRELRIVGLRPTESPPAMTVEATISARRYLESRATGAVLEGSRDRDTTFTLVWELRAAANPHAPWRIVGVSAPFRRFRSRLHRLRTQFVNEIQVLLGRPSGIDSNSK